MNTPLTPQQARALRSRKQHERQAVVFGLLIALLAATGVVGLAVYTGALSFPGSADFVAKEKEPGTTFTAPQPCVPSGTVPVGRKKIKVTVLNGSDRAGLAAVVSDLLTDEGFTVEGTGNDTRRPSQPIISFGPKGITRAYTLLAYVPEARLVLDTRPGASVDLTVPEKVAGLVPSDQVVLDPEIPLESVAECLELDAVTPQPAPARFTKTEEATEEPAAG